MTKEYKLKMVYNPNNGNKVEFYDPNGNLYDFNSKDWTLVVKRWDEEEKGYFITYSNKDNRKHNENGPAVICPNGLEMYFIKGHPLTEEEFYLYKTDPDFKRFLLDLINTEEENADRLQRSL